MASLVFLISFTSIMLYPVPPAGPFLELMIAATAAGLLTALLRAKNRQCRNAPNDSSEIRKILYREASSISKPPSIDTLNRFANRTGLSLEEYLGGLKKSPPIYRGMKSLMENDYDAAIKLFNKNANKLRKEASINLFFVGNGLYHQGKYKAALTAYQKSITLNPGFAKAWFNCGKTLDALGLHVKARAKYKKAQELNPRPAAIIKDPDQPLKRRNHAQEFKGKRKRPKVFKTGFFKKRSAYDAPMNTRPYKGNSELNWLIMRLQ